MSFQQGLSGLNAAAKQLDTIGNNVANANTVGFKQSQAQFADLYAVSLQGGGGIQAGTGVRVAAIAQQFTQGNVTNTNNAMDTAISGQGFFTVTDQSGATLYTRNGQFQVDKDGFIVTNQGHQVNGYLAVDGTITANQGPLQINAADLIPRQTANVAIGANLNSSADVPVISVFDPNVPTSYNNSTSLTIFDSLGASHVGTLYFQRQPIAATTVPLAVGALATSVTLASSAGIAVGDTITIAGAGTAGAPHTTTITAIAGNTVTFAPATLNAVALAAGAIVTSNAGSDKWATYMSVDGVLVPPSNTASAAVAAGATTVTLTDFPTGLDIGDQIVIAGAGPNGEPLTVTVAAPLPVFPATTVTFAPATSTAVLIGATLTLPMNILDFDTQGRLEATIPPSSPLGIMDSVAFTPTSAASQTLSFDFTNVSQYGGNFGVSSLTQDGYASGRLNGFSTSQDGTILGRYSNGQTQVLGQMLLANFTNPQGLQPVGNNEWVETSSSGSPLIGVPGSSSLGLLQSSAVEDSNVDLTAELVNMITAQRVYQANAQTIKAQDQVLQTLVNLR